MASTPTSLPRRWCPSSLRRNRAVQLFEGSARRCRSQRMRGNVCLLFCIMTCPVFCFIPGVGLGWVGCRSQIPLMILILWLRFISQRPRCQSDNPRARHSSRLPSSLPGAGRHVVQRSPESCRHHSFVQDVQQHGPPSCGAGEDGASLTLFISTTCL